MEKKKVPRTMFLHALLSVLKRSSMKVSGDTVLSDMGLSFEVPEAIRLHFEEKFSFPPLPDSIINRIPTNMDFQDETSLQNSEADMQLTVRNLAISITLWYMANHKKAVLALTSN